jgi:hypothetical protein
MAQSARGLARGEGKSQDHGAVHKRMKAVVLWPELDVVRDRPCPLLAADGHRVVDILDDLFEHANPSRAARPIDRRYLQLCF